jgi:hypothetical protein
MANADHQKPSEGGSSITVRDCCADRNSGESELARQTSVSWWARSELAAGLSGIALAGVVIWDGVS